MKRIDKAIIAVALALVAGVVFSTCFFRGNVDEWGGDLSEHDYEIREMADGLNAIATAGMGANPDGYYRFEDEDRTHWRYYLFWRIIFDAEKVPDVLAPVLGEASVGDGVEAVGLAASANASVFGWKNRYHEQIRQWLNENGLSKARVDVFVYVNDRWRAAGTLFGQDAEALFGADDVEAVRKGRFNCVQVVR